MVSQAFWLKAIRERPKCFGHLMSGMWSLAFAVMLARPLIVAGALVFRLKVG